MQRDEIHPDIVTYGSLIKSHSKSLIDLGKMRRNGVSVGCRFARSAGERNVTIRNSAGGCRRRNGNDALKLQEEERGRRFECDPRGV